MENILMILMVIFSTICGALGSVYLKKSAKRFNLNVLEQIRNKYLYLGFILFVLGTASYVYALTLGRLSIVYPLTALTYIWVSLMSFYLLKEKFSYRKLVAISIIICGIVIVVL